MWNVSHLRDGSSTSEKIFLIFLSFSDDDPQRQTIVIVRLCDQRANDGIVEKKIALEYLLENPLIVFHLLGDVSASVSASTSDKGDLTEMMVELSGELLQGNGFRHGTLAIGQADEDTGADVFFALAFRKDLFDAVDQCVAFHPCVRHGFCVNRKSLCYGHTETGQPLYFRVLYSVTNQVPEDRQSIFMAENRIDGDTSQKIIVKITASSDRMLVAEYLTYVDRAWQDLKSESAELQLRLDPTLRWILAMVLMHLRASFGAAREAEKKVLSNGKIETKLNGFYDREWTCDSERTNKMNFARIVLFDVVRCHSAGQAEKPSIVAVDFTKGVPTTSLTRQFIDSWLEDEWSLSRIEKWRVPCDVCHNNDFTNEPISIFRENTPTHPVRVEVNICATCMMKADGKYWVQWITSERTKIRIERLDNKERWVTRLEPRPLDELRQYYVDVIRTRIRKECRYASVCDHCERNVRCFCGAKPDCFSVYYPKTQLGCTTRQYNDGLMTGYCAAHFGDQKYFSETVIVRPRNKEELDDPEYICQVGCCGIRPIQAGSPYRKSYLLFDESMRYLFGTKQRVAARYVRQQKSKRNDVELVYAGPTFGMGALALALGCQEENMPFRLFLSGPRLLEHMTPSQCKHIELCQCGLAETVRRAKTYVAQAPLTRQLVKFGLDDEAYRQLLLEDLRSDQVLCDLIASRVRLGHRLRVWICVGSGTLLRVLMSVFPPDTEFHAVQVGKRLKLSDSRIIKYVAPENLGQPAQVNPPYSAFPYFDAKIWRFVQLYGEKGDIIWNIASDLQFA